MAAPAFVLSRYAREELERRGIRREMPDEVLARPEQIVPGHGGLTVYQYRIPFGGQVYLLRAVVDLIRDRADYDAEGSIVGMEILAASRRVENPRSMEYAIQD